MKNKNFWPFLISLICLTSCNLGGESVPCDTRQFFSAAEFYVIEENGVNYLSGDDGSANRFTLCEQINPSDTSGFGNLYSVDGVLHQDCSNNICIRADRFDNPFCQLDYDIGGGNLPLFGLWRIASLTQDSVTFYPSCNRILLSLNITPDSDETIYFTEGIFGINSFFITLKPVDEDGLLVENITRTFEPNSPYAAIVEDKLSTFFTETDTIRFSIQSNQMLFETSDEMIQFFQVI